MDLITAENKQKQVEPRVVEELYKRYASLLLRYTVKNYRITEDDARNLCYKTIFRMAEVNNRYPFDNELKRKAFIFKTHINYLRNYFRDNKSFEVKHTEVELKDIESADNSGAAPESRQLRLLKELLDKMEDWQRMLLLLRGQGMSYHDISAFADKPARHLKVYYARLKKQLLKDMNDKLQHR